ncbi:MAG TPA: hypothetical protein ENK85_11035 [Saprospiraceae bacterium]|nr:hypothetical protein [Saprospiraceae bacterium]
MEKILLHIVTLTQSVTQAQNFAVVLSEENGNRRLPIVIGNSEAQAIAVALEGMVPTRPLTHDLFKNTLDTFNITLNEVRISELVDGIFYAKLICSFQGDIFEVDARSSDAIALAVRFECPIYTYEKVLAEAGIILDEDKDKPKKVKKERRKEGALTNYTIKELNELLGKTVASEDYEKAALIRDELTRRSKGS